MGSTEKDVTTANKMRDKSGKFLKGNPYTFKPGQINNPNGRPPNEMSITAQLRKILEAKDGEGYEIVAQSIYKTLKDLDEKHSASILKDAQDRLEGKAPDRVEVSGPKGEAIKITGADIKRGD